MAGTLTPFRKNVVPRESGARVKLWTRERFGLSDDASVLVAEVACTLPGCPPRETVVAFWTEGDKRHSFKIFKPASEVVEDDIPPSWMKNALADSETIGIGCC